MVALQVLGCQRRPEAIRLAPAVLFPHQFHDLLPQRLRLGPVRAAMAQRLRMTHPQQDCRLTQRHLLACDPTQHLMALEFPLVQLLPAHQRTSLRRVCPPAQRWRQPDYCTGSGSLISSRYLATLPATCLKGSFLDVEEDSFSSACNTRPAEYVSRGFGDDTLRKKPNRIAQSDNNFYAVQGVADRKRVNHSMSGFVQGTGPSSGIDSPKSVLRRARQGTFRKISGKVLASDASKNTGGHKVRDVTLAGSPASLAATFKARDVPIL